MRSPESRVGYRPGRTFEEELNLRYLSPGAFTVLSPEESGSPPDPPTAPQPYRLSPNNARRHKNQSFSIIAEPVNSTLSRSPSPPSGRVSPFRGRGFNPTGSRHASPAHSPPPPDDNRHSIPNNQQGRTRKSNIPQLRRRNSSVVLTEDSSDSSPKHKRSQLLRPQLSKSLNHIASRSVPYKPPTGPSTRRPQGVYARNHAFARLSPIIGSSPEPSSDSKSQSSPTTRIPKSYSSPSSRKPSPSRSPDVPKRASTRVQSRAASRSTSRNPSREVSPMGKPPFSPTKIPVKNYRNVPAKVNSNNAKRSKPKVPNNDKNVDDFDQKTSNKISNSNKSNSRLNRSESVSKISKNQINNSNRQNNNAAKNSMINGNNNNNNNNNSINSNGTSSNQKEKMKPLMKRASSKLLNNKKDVDSNDESPTKSHGKLKSTVKKVESVPKITDLLPSASAVVSNTTSTVTQPLKIEAKLETPPSAGTTDKRGPASSTTSTKPKETPMYMDEGRVLSATSVSSAIERMNDTVLDSQTLLKDHNISKLSPAASAVVSLSNDNSKNINSNNTTSTSKSVTMPNVEIVSVNNNGQTLTANNFNHNSDSIILKGGNVVNNNVNKLISPDDSFGAKVHYEDTVHNNSSAATTVLPITEVKPIKIMVQGKPDSMEVQSGNVRFPPNVTNGVAFGPGAPQQQQTAEGEEAEITKKNRCQRLMDNLKQKVLCTTCRKTKSPTEHVDEETPKQGCFACLKKKKLHDVEEIIISAADEEVEEAKKTLWQKLKCCKSNKIGDSTTGCCGRGKRKQSWVERRDSILSDAIPLTRSAKCRNFFKALFCCCGCGWATRCCKKQPPPPKIDDITSRRASLLSKKKSLTPTVLPPEDPKNKLDPSLVEYTSTMKAAIPVLPVVLAYICLVCNIFAPGTGTVFSGLFCLCMGKPRFSPRDGIKPRLGSFFINTFIGAGQLFTVLFCLVGWGWSIWWGVIMVRVARKYKKLKLIEKRLESQQEKQGSNSRRDVEKGRT